MHSTVVLMDIPTVWFNEEYCPQHNQYLYVRGVLGIFETKLNEGLSIALRVCDHRLKAVDVHSNI